MYIRGYQYTIISMAEWLFRKENILINNNNECMRNILVKAMSVDILIIHEDYGYDACHCIPDRLVQATIPVVNIFFFVFKRKYI